MSIELGWKRLFPYLDSTDLYKFTMDQVFRTDPSVLARFRLFVRPGTTLHPKVGEYLIPQIQNNMPYVKLSNEGREHLLGLPFIDESYVHALDGYQYNPDQVSIIQDNSGLRVTAEGLHTEVTHWEIPILQLVTCIDYGLKFPQGPPNPDWEEDVFQQALFIKKYGLSVVDFSTRRTPPWIQDSMLDIMFKHAGSTFLGTSNVNQAAKRAKRSFGTTAHELDQRNAGIYGVRNASLMTMKQWTDFYGGSLGVVLPDTFGIETFLKGFNLAFARGYTGPRHDSSDPYWFTDKFVDHYLSLGLSPAEIATKSIVFSNSLRVNEELLNLRDHCDSRGIGCSFGIGNGLVRATGYPSLNIVFKLEAIKYGHWDEWIYTPKAPDELGKFTGNHHAGAAYLFELNRAQNMFEAMGMLGIEN